MDRRTMDDLETYVAVSDHERAWDAHTPGKALAAVQLAGVRAGGRIADLGSGQGWHARRLGRDFDVVAVEQEPRLAAEAARRGRARPGRRTLFLVASTQDVPIRDASIDGAISLGTSLGFGTRDEDRGMLEEVRRMLRPGARAVIEALSADSASSLALRTCTYPDGTNASYAPRFDSGTQTLYEHQRVTLPDGRDGGVAYRLHAYDPGELLVLARQAGLDEIGVFGSLERKPWRSPDPVVMVLRRPEAACSVCFERASFNGELAER